MALWLVALVATLAVAAPAATLAASQAMVPACAGVNLRASASTSATIRVRLSTSATVTVVAKVSGGSWSTTCPTFKSGSSWYRISAVNGKSVSSLYGVSYIYAATGVLKAAPAPTPTPTPTPPETPTPTPSPAETAMVPACAGVNLRASASTSATIRVRLSTSATVTVVAKVSGGSWSTTCPTLKSGSSWYRISAVNGKSVSSLYGVSYIYAATGVLKAAPAPEPTPTSSPTHTP